MFFQTGIFGTLEGKTIVRVESLSNLEQMNRNGGIQKYLKSKAASADSNFRPGCEGSGKAKDLPTLAPRVEARNETQKPRGGKRGVGGGNLVSEQTLEHPSMFSLIFRLKWVGKTAKCPL
ncbi:hypothetical protein AVEN_95486-1 [Araneus ventricosus]|uniref:Uncharacterized protein n=1 Tax=Araneus ventricosus TaxID=182803 RepID=A0A4Y2F592_ARAVE|nr:hypothetical protein AVEN_95486-1 [Araneus ventricosus]